MRLTRYKVINLLNDNKNIFSVFYNWASGIIRAFANFFRNWELNYHRIFLLLLLVVGFLIRLPYIKFGLPYQHNCDEAAVVETAVKILQNADLNPHFFRYPSLTTYLQIPFYILNYCRLVSIDKIISIHDISFENWNITHPSFFAVSRLTMVLFCTLSILLIYQVGKRYFNKKVGLLSALISTFFVYDIWFLRVTSPNQTVSFFVLLSLFTLSLYIEKKHLKYIFLIGVFSGLTVAAKYNAFLVISPIILGILFYSDRRLRDICIIIFSTAAGFFIGCPYAIFDLDTFLKHTAEEIRHYKIIGHSGSEGTPGLPQVRYYLNEFKGWAESTFHIKGTWNVTLIGIITYGLMDIRNFLVIFSFPFLYIFYMSQQKVNFIRNMSCIMPFIALFTAVTLYLFYTILVKILNYIGKNKLFSFKIQKDFLFIGYFLALFIFFKPIEKLENGYKYMKTYKESRTEAVDYVRDNFINYRIGISKELWIHPFDLNKIHNKKIINTERQSLAELYYNFDYIISSDSFSKYFYEENCADRIMLLRNKFSKENIIKSFGLGDAFIDFLSNEPKINIYKVDESFIFDKQDENKIIEIRNGPIRFSDLKSNIKEVIGDNQLNMLWNCHVVTQLYKYEKGDYLLNVLASGTIAKNEWPILELKLISLGSGSIKEFDFSERKEIAAESDKWYQYYFTLENNSIIALNLIFNNDCFDEATGEDRNIYIKKIEIKHHYCPN